MLSRPLVPGEINILGERCIVNCALEISNPNRIGEYIEKIQKYMIGTHCATDGKTIFSKQPETPIRIPNSFSDLASAAQYFSETKMHPYSKTLSSIGYNDHQIVISSAHLVGDGMYYHQLVKDIQDPNYVQKKLPSFPEPMTIAFAKEIAQHDMDFIYRDRSNMTTLVSRENPKNLPKPDGNSFCRTHHFRIPVQELAAYSQKTGKLHLLTDYLWTSLTLSFFAFEGKIGPFGCSTCVDMRKALKTKGMFGPQHTNIFSIIWPHAPIHPDFTIHRAGELIRDNMNFQTRRGDVFDLYAKKPKDENHRGSMAEISSLPPFVVRKPITDVLANVTLPDFGYNSFTITSESIINEDKGTNEFTGYVRFDPSAMTSNEAKLITNSIEYFLRNMKLTTTVGDAVRELQKFQSQNKTL